MSVAVDTYRAHLQHRLSSSGVPEQLHEGLREYLAARRPVGHFLTAVLSNDLKEACARADEFCAPNLHRIVFFLYNYAPAFSWGSAERVNAWLTDPAPPVELFE